MLKFKNLTVIILLFTSNLSWSQIENKVYENGSFELILTSGDTLNAKILKKSSGHISVLNLKTDTKRIINYVLIKSVKSLDKDFDKLQLLRLILTTKDTLWAKLISKDSTNFNIINLANNKKVDIQIAQITKIDNIDSSQIPKKIVHIWEYAGRYYSRNGITPTAIPLKKGEFYYRNNTLFYNSFESALTNHLTMGFTFVPLISEEGRTSWGFNARISTQIGNKNYIGFNAFMYKDNFEGINSVYGLAIINTYGSTLNHITLGLGTILETRQSYSLNPPFTLLDPKLVVIPTLYCSGQKHFGKSFFLMCDMIFAPDGNIGTTYPSKSILAFTTGIRFKSKFGAFDVMYYDEVKSSIFSVNPPFPLVGYGIQFR